MKIVIFIPAFFIFLFTLFKLIKDDHVFLRRNIKIEHVFDCAFILIIVILIFQQFSIFRDSIYLSNIIIGAVLSLFLFGRYKKIPLGRLFDFFTLSFLTTIPIIYFLNILFAKKDLLIFFIISAVFYFFLAIFFLNSIFKKLISRNIKEGNATVYFLVIQSVFSLSYFMINSVITRTFLFRWENIYLSLQLILSIIILIKQKNFTK